VLQGVSIVQRRIKLNQTGRKRIIDVTAQIINYKTVCGANLAIDSKAKDIFFLVLWVNYCITRPHKLPQRFINQSHKLSHLSLTIYDFS